MNDLKSEVSTVPGSYNVTGKITEVYESTDIGLCAYLAITYPIKRAEVDEYNKVIFIFDETDALLADIDKYFLGQALVSPVRYSFELQNLKQLIRSRLRESDDY